MHRWRHGRRGVAVPDNRWPSSDTCGSRLPAADLGSVGPDVEELYRLEHGRWVSTKVGWEYAAVRDDQAKRSPFWVPWEQLSPEGRQRTAFGVDGVLERMATIGLAPVRREFRRVGLVDARRLTEDHSWVAQGDPLEGKAGDWLVLASDGTERTVGADRFDALYELVAGVRYRRRGTVHARQVAASTPVRTLEGTADARPGDWIVEGPGGESWPVPAAEFARSYQEVAPGSIGPVP